MTIRPSSLPAGAYPNGPDAPPALEPGHPAVVEWRAITVITLSVILAASELYLRGPVDCRADTYSDRIHQLICQNLGIGEDVLSLAQVLESATWKGGREIAAEKRKGGGRECGTGHDFFANGYFSSCRDHQRRYCILSKKKSA
jgi:hypothetical protein